MVKIILPTQILDAKYADISIATGRFNALIISDLSTSEIIQAFSGVEHFTVESDDSPDKYFDGFKYVDSLETRGDGILIRLRKEG